MRHHLGAEAGPNPVLRPASHRYITSIAAARLCFHSKCIGTWDPETFAIIVPSEFHGAHQRRAEIPQFRAVSGAPGIRMAEMSRRLLGGGVDQLLQRSASLSLHAGAAAAAGTASRLAATRAAGGRWRPTRGVLSATRERPTAASGSGTCPPGHHVRTGGTDGPVASYGAVGAADVDRTLCKRPLRPRPASVTHAGSLGTGVLPQLCLY